MINFKLFIVLSPAVLKDLNIPDVRYKSALKQRLPLGGSAIIQAGRWMTIEMAEILAMLIIEFENKPAKERKELMKQLAEKNKIVMYTFVHMFEKINP